MTSCKLCPRQCGVDRNTVRGVCRMGSEAVVARAAPHFGEEPCISGEKGSGTVFFAGCTLRCVFCQNYELSRGRAGEAVTPAQLADIFRRLEAQGVHNLNLVSGTQFVPAILEALELARPAVPVVWNSSGYETPETVRALSRYVSVFLPDMKYILAGPAHRYSYAGDYPAAAKKAIETMVECAGPYELDENGLLTRGVLIRHLVLPGQVENSRRVIRWVSETFLPGEVLFSLMAQYTPCGELEKYPELQRTLTQAEWAACLEELERSDITDGFVQELAAAGEEMIPAFDGTGVSIGR